jgi:hypothetical protein
MYYYYISVPLCSRTSSGFHVGGIGFADELKEVKVWLVIDNCYIYVKLPASVANPLLHVPPLGRHFL